MYEEGGPKFGPDDYVLKTSQLVFNAGEVEDYAGEVRRRIADYFGVAIRPSLPTHLTVKSAFGLSAVKRHVLSRWLRHAAATGRIAPMTANISGIGLSRESPALYLVVSNPSLVRMRRYILSELETMGYPCFGYEDEGDELHITVANGLELDDTALRRAETLLKSYPHPRSLYISEIICYQKAAPDTPWCPSTRMQLMSRG